MISHKLLRSELPLYKRELKDAVRRKDWSEVARIGAHIELLEWILNANDED